MDKIYVFGHRNPDTDSVGAAISLSYLKNKLGFDTMPVILSDISEETKYALDYFHVDKPAFINDVKVKLKDVNYKRDYYIDQKESLYDGFMAMSDAGISKIPVVNENKEFLGILGMKDIAKDQINGNIEYMHTSYSNIIDVLKGEEVLKFDEEIEGKLMVASYKSTRIIENIGFTKENILIVGDRHSVIESAVKSKIKLIILTGNSQIKDEHLEIARKNKVNVIRTQYNTLHVSRVINLCNYISTVATTNKILCVTENDNLTDFIDLVNKTKYSYYPVVENGICLGIIRLSDTAEKNIKKVMLVDHNTVSQTVEGIEEAEILEVVDHHNIGNIATASPISFRNMPVGSSNTIIYQMYLENNIEIPKDVAGMMLSGILSDTLILKSPTTTEKDRIAVENLSKIAKVNYEEYGFELLKAGASLKGKTLEEVLYTDFKTYPFNDAKLGIGQIFIIDPDEVLDRKDEYIKLFDELAENSGYEILTLFVTDILNNGSYVIYNSKASETIAKAFNLPEAKEGFYLKDVVSRKLQVLPNLLKVQD